MARGQGGFSLVELLTVIIIITLLLGLGSWVLLSNRSSQATRSGETQLVADLRVCATVAETEKRAYGLLLRGPTCATNPNTYTFLRVNDDGTVTEMVSPPPGASYRRQYIELPSQAKFTTFAPAVMTFDNQKQIKIYFNPVGELLYSQYGDAGNARTDLNENVTAGISDSAGTNVRTVTVYKLGEVGP